MGETFGAFVAGEAVGFTPFTIHKPKVVGVYKNDVFVADAGLAEEAGALSQGAGGLSEAQAE